MKYESFRNELVSLGKSLFDRGYSCGGGGNMSLRLPDGNILATPTGSSMGRLDPDSLSVVDLDGNTVSGKRPSKEVAFHLSLYNMKAECNAVVHLHSTYLTALSCSKDLDPEDAVKPFTPYYVMRIGCMPVIEYLPPGSPRIAEELERLAFRARAFLLRNHGPVVTGKDIFDAVDNAEELEETAKLLWILKDTEIRYLEEEDINYLKDKIK